MKFIAITILFGGLILLGCNQESTSTIVDIPTATSENSMYPRLFTDNTGTVFMSWLEKKSNLTALRYASLKENNWSTPQTIAADSTWFVNWADFPSIIAQNGTPLASHWLNKIPGGTYAYEINISAFDEKWPPYFVPHTDDTPTEHGFVSMYPASDSTFMAVWLDGRNTAGRTLDEYDDTSKAMSLRAALIHRSGAITEQYLLDSIVCDCCNTAIAQTENGFVVAYRNRTEDEIRDIYTVTIDESGISKPRPVHADNWKINACPVNGPAIAAKANYVALVWFTGAGGKSSVNLAISKDGGQSYSPPILVDKKTKGRVDVEINHDKIWISRFVTENDEQVLKISSYSLKGAWISDHILEGISTDRGSGFPQITASIKGLVIAYTNTLGEQKSVHTKLLQIDTK